VAVLIGCQNDTTTTTTETPPQNYTITYILNGGQNHVANPNTFTESDLPLTILAASRSGHEFRGWFTNPNFTGTVVTQITQVGNIRLYAQWDEIVENEYTITYFLGGGQNHANNPATFRERDLPLTLEPATRAGHDFVGWFTNPSFTGEAVTQITQVGNVVLYAQFEAETVYTITYILNGGTNHANNPATFVANELPLQLYDASREGYDFLGWFTASDLSGTPIREITQASNITLYAGFEEQEVPVEIIYHLNGGTNHPDNPTSLFQSQFPFTLLKPTQEGFDFIGWFRTSDFSGSPVTVLNATDTDFELFAQWFELVDYAITYHLNGGENHELNPDYYNRSMLPLVFRTPTRDGYQFIGWFENPLLTGAMIRSLQEGQTGDLNLYAKWEAEQTFNISFELNGGVFGFVDPADLFTEFLTDLHSFLRFRNLAGLTPDLNTFMHGAGNTSGFNGTFRSGNTVSGDIMPLLFVLGQRNFNPSMGNPEDFFIYHPDFRDRWLPFFDQLNLFMLRVNPAQNFWNDRFAASVRIVDWILNLRAGSPAFAPNTDFMPEGPYVPTTISNAVGITLPIPRGNGEFLGWFDNPLFGGIVYSVIPAGATGNRTFYARWAVPSETFDIYVSAEWVGKSAGETVTHLNFTLTIGTNAFATLQEAIDFTAEGSSIFVLPGIYSGATINKNFITIVGPNAFVDPNLDIRGPEANIVGAINVGANVQGLMITGMAFNGAGQVIGAVSGGIDNFVFSYNNASGISSIPGAEGILDFPILNDADKNSNFIITNNRFHFNSQLRHVRLMNIQNLEVINNVFQGSATRTFTDALRLTGTNNMNAGGIGVAGDVVINHNKFFSIGQRAIWFHRYTAENIEIQYNLFDDIGSFEAGEPINIVTWAGVSTVINIRFNTFSNVGVNGAMQTIRLHNQDAQPGDWIANINFNSFTNIQGTRENFTLITNGGNAINEELLINAETNFFDGRTPSDMPIFFVGVQNIGVYIRNEDDLPDMNFSADLSPQSIVITNSISRLELFSEYLLRFEVLPDNATDKRVTFTTSNRNVLQVSNTGLLYAVGYGTATVTIATVVNELVAVSITITVYKPDYIDVFYTNTSALNVGEEEMLVVVRNGYEGVLEFTSSDSAIATVDSSGLVKAVSPGVALISVGVDGQVLSTAGITVLEPLTAEDALLQLLINSHNSNIMRHNSIDVTGFQFIYQHDLLHSVNQFLFQEHNVIEHWIPLGGVGITHNNRPGTVRQKHYVVIHDTGSSAPGAGALAHANFVAGGGNGTSWHYTTGNDGIFQHIPDNEIAFHAGDGSVQFGLTDTGVAATVRNPIVTISADGFWVLNGNRTTIQAPRNGTQILTAADINDQGIRVEIHNGTYWVGITYWNATYRRIANRGGNQNGIGIEKAINQGSDLFLTWQKTAKLTANLLVNNGLELDAIQQHHFFSGKNCPQTMRGVDGGWEDFLALVATELEVLRYFSEYTITFEIISGNEFLTNAGRTSNNEGVAQAVAYRITVSRGSYERSVILHSVIPGRFS